VQSSSKSKSDTKLSRSQSIVLSIVSFTKMQFLLIFWLWITTTFTTSALERCRRQATSHALLLLYRVKVIFSSCAPATSVNCEVRTLVSPTSPSISGQGYAKVIPHCDGRTKQKSVPLSKHAIINMLIINMLIIIIAPHFVLWK
jgi:hypothetical protein